MAGRKIRRNVFPYGNSATCPRRNFYIKKAGLLASGSRIHSVPSRYVKRSQWLPCGLRRISPVTAAGPQRFCTVFPFKPFYGRLLTNPKIIRKTKGSGFACFYADGVSEKVEDKAIASKARVARVVIIPEKGENPAGEAPGL